MKYVKRPKYNTGGQIGSALGSTATSFIPGVGPLLAPIGGMVGGAIGSMFNKKPEVTYKTVGSSMKNGGKIKNIGKGAKKYVGPKHEQGGIPVTQAGTPTSRNNAVAEVEGGETVQDSYVFSDTLKVPNTNLTFAQAHEMLIKEGASEQEVQELAMVQEQMNGGQSTVMVNGGDIPVAGKFPFVKPAMQRPPLYQKTLPTTSFKGQASPYRVPKVPQSPAPVPKFNSLGPSATSVATKGVGAVTKGAGALAGILLDPVRVGNSEIYNTPEEAQKIFGFKSPSEFEPPMLLRKNGEPNVGEQLWRNAMNRYSQPSESQTTVPSTVPPLRSTQNNPPTGQMTGSTTGSSATSSEKPIVNDWLTRGKPDSKYNLDTKPMRMKSLPFATTVSEQPEKKPTDWAGVATGIQAGTRIGAALFAPKPKASPRASYVPLSTTSPAFNNARRQAGAGFVGASKANPNMAYAQYLDATSNIATSEADFKSQREATNEQMRQNIERTNMEQTMRDNVAKDQDLASRIGLVAQGIDIPVTKMATDKAMKDANITAIYRAAALLPEVERQRYIDQAMADYRLKRLGGKLKKRK